MPSFIKTLSRFLAYFLVAALILSLLVLASLSAIIPPVASSIAARYGIQLDIDNVDIGWTRGKLAIHNVRAAAVESDANTAKEEVASLKEIAVDLNLTRLVRKRQLVVDTFSVEGLYLPAEIALGPDNELERIAVAGIDPEQIAASNESSNKEDAVEQGDSAPAIVFKGWRKITMRDVALQSQLYKGEQNQAVGASLAALDIGALDVDEAQQKTPVSLQLMLNDIKASISGEAAPLAPGREGHAALSVSGVELGSLKSIADFLAVDTASLQSADGALSLVSNISWWLAGDRNFFTLESLEFNGDSLKLALSGESDGEAAEQGGGQGDSQNSVANEMAVDANLQLNAERIKVSTSPVNYSVNELAFVVDALSVRDPQLDPPLELDISAVNMQLDQIDCNHKDKPTALQLDAAIGRYGKLMANASGTFLHENAGGSIELNGEQINLTELSGLAKNAIGKHIDKGALDLHYAATVESGKLDSKAKIEAHQLGLSGDFGSKTNFVEELGMPLNAALNLLRDKDDTVRLTVPVKGDLADPQVKIGKIVNKAVLNGVKTAVMTQFGPLLALSALDKAKNLATGLQLKPVVFTQGQKDIDGIDKEMSKHLQTIADLLAKRPKIKLNVCGVAAVSETSRLVEGLETKTVDLNTLKAEDKKPLYELATGRAEAVKDYLVERGVEGRRLIVCAPEIDNAIESDPRTEFSL